MNKISAVASKVVSRFLPDAYIFCILLTIVVFIIAMPVAGLSPIGVIQAWGDGFWSLLAFSMQMVLVLVLGNAFANAPAIKKVIDKIAGIPKSPKAAIFTVALIGMICMWLNWGFGLVVGALLARAVARETAKKGLKVDYRLLIATAYAPIAIWHPGVSGSIPLALAGTPESLATVTAGAVTESVSTAQTIFAPWNLIMVAIVAIGIILVMVFSHPAEKDTVVIDASKLVDDPEPEKIKGKKTPAEALENSVIIMIITVVAGAAYIIYYFVNAGNILNALSLNIVNFIFLILGIAFHKTPIGYVRAILDSMRGAGGIVLQFPFYAGIQGMMIAVGSTGNSVASSISNFFVTIATTRTFGFFTYIAAGIVNFFVPSGGGQWAVQGPIMMPAGAALGVPPAITAMGIAWGDAWTNLLQPFWALPALGIAGLGARDIMGYCFIALVVSGILTAIGFLVIVPALVPM